MTLKKIIIAFLFLNVSFLATAQEVNDTKKELNKIQEVVTLEPAPQAEGDTGMAKPLAKTEVLKRAVKFIQTETLKYTKSSLVNAGNKAECLVTFKYKPKELNPQANVEGTISMHLSIEAKDGKYRYTISKINHTAKNEEYTGGDIYTDVPVCGSMKLASGLWKQMKSEAFKDAAILTADLKETMKVSSDVKNDKDEW